MSARSLNGLNGTNTNVVITNRMLATLPLEMTQLTFLDPIVLSMKGLSGFGGANKVIKVNGTNNGLIYADDLTENITVSSPLVRTADNISIIGLSTTFAGAGKVIKINSTNDGLEYADDISLWTASSNILTPVDTNNNIIKLIQSGTDSAIIGDIANPSNTGKPFIKYGSFETLYGKDTRHISASIQNFSSGSLKAVDLTCNPNSNLLEIDNSINVNGIVECDSIKLTDSTNQITDGTNDFILPSSSGTLALTSDIGTSIFSVSSEIIEPIIATNNKIKLTNSATFSSISGDITNPSNASYPYIKYGSFETLYGQDTRHISMSIQNFGSGSIKLVNLTCNTNSNLLEIDNSINVDGNVECDFINLTDSANQIKSGGLTYTLPTSSGFLALSTDTPWSVSGGTIQPRVSTDNEILLQGTGSQLIGTITNAFNTNYPYVENGAFQYLYSEQLYCSGQFRVINPNLLYSVNLTCNSTKSQLRIDEEVFIFGDLTLSTGGATSANAIIDGNLTSSSQRFKTNYLSSRCYLTNPSGTDNAVSFAGSFLAYHDNGTELTLNCPNATYSNSLDSNMSFMFNGKSKIKFFGSETKAQQFFQDDGATPYFQTGRTSTFPTNMGPAWSGVSVPILNAFYQGGTNTNDTEGFWFCQNGQTTAFSSTADLQAMRWYNEDSITTGWSISSTGSITTFSDRRLKTDIKDYKNSSFEKYSQIRTVVYKEKIPDTINPKRLTKQSCIDHYNEKHYGIIAQEIYELYPELNICCEVRDKKKWDYRKENWDNGVYEEEHKQWLIDKEKFICQNKEEDKDCCYNQKEPQKIFDEEEPILRFDYNRLNIITVGVVQDLIKENKNLKTELDDLKNMMNKLINSKSFSDFKKGFI